VDTPLTPKKKQKDGTTKGSEINRTIKCKNSIMFSNIIGSQLKRI
jgi:hypothetical protein